MLWLLPSVPPVSREAAKADWWAHARLEHGRIAVPLKLDVNKHTHLRSRRIRVLVWET